MPTTRRSAPARSARRSPSAAAPDIRTLAEALILRADCQKRIEQLKARLLRAAKVQEGDRPPEDPDALLRELDGVSEQLLTLIQRINRTNSATNIDGEGSISDAIARRDVLRLRHAIYRDLAASAVVLQDRRTKSEVRFKSTVNIADIQGRADDFAKAHRELDAKIQAANWKTEVMK